MPRGREPAPAGHRGTFPLDRAADAPATLEARTTLAKTLLLTAPVTG